ncbi:MAG: LysM domain-containing protein [Candidatus Rokubacteria bacterium]|nr:LysM domain-containing protein [Candidatus Rokubacteria bacterium]
MAARFGTTVKAIAELNGIADPSRIRVGQVLRIP